MFRVLIRCTPIFSHLEFDPGSIRVSCLPLPAKSLWCDVNLNHVPKLEKTICKCKYKCKEISHYKTGLYEEFTKLDEKAKRNYLMGLMDILPVAERRHGSYHPSDSRNQATISYNVPNNSGNMKKVTRGINVFNNNQVETVSNRMNVITKFLAHYYDDKNLTNNPCNGKSCNHDISEINAELCIEENFKDKNKNSQRSKLSDSNRQFGSNAVNNKRTIEEINCNLNRPLKQIKAVDKQEEHCKLKDDYQHISDEGKLNRQQKISQKLCNRIKKNLNRIKGKNLPLNDLRRKLESRNVSEVERTREKCSLNCIKDEKVKLDSFDEDQIHKSIIYTRRIIQAESIVSSEMEWTTSCVNQIEFESRFYIVLDTNVLVTSINFVKKLRNMSGNGCPLLLIPYQVLLELDHLKQKKSAARIGARQAIDVIYQTFKMGSPHIHGQSASEAQDFSINLDKNIPDDAIINCCLQQVKKGNCVILLTLDKNLSSKALMNDVKVYSIYDLSKTVSEAKSKSVSLKQAIFGDKTMSAVINTHYGITEIIDVSSEEPIITEISGNFSSLSTDISDKLKDCLNLFVNKVLQRGMTLRYGEEWVTRYAIKPPWNLERGLKCLLHNWYAIMETFAKNDIKPTIQFLLKAFQENSSTLKTSSTWTQNTEMKVMEAAGHLSSALSAKYATLASTFNRTINELRSMINEQPVVDVNSIDEQAIGTDEQAIGTDEQAFVVASAFGDMWTLLWQFCTSLYIALGWDKPQSPFASAPSLEGMKEYLTLYYSTAFNLLQAASGILEADFEELTVTHSSVVLFHTTVYGFLVRVKAPLLHDISTQNVLTFLRQREYSTSLYIALGWDKPQSPFASAPSLEGMKEYLTLYYSTAFNLLQAASGILEADFEELTVTHSSVVLFHTTVYGFLVRVRAPLLHDISTQNVLTFLRQREYRDKLSDIISPLEALSSKFMKCIDYFLEMEEINC